HERGGAKVLSHLHGTTFTFRCFECDSPAEYDLEDATDEQLAATPELDQLKLEDPPKCTSCSHGFIRPDIVLFSVQLPQQAMDAVVNRVGLADGALVGGTYNIVQPAASLPVAASAAGAKLIEVNTSHTPLSDDADDSINGTASSILPELF